MTEGETEEEARTSANDCVIAALEGYMKAGRPVPRPSRPDPTHNRAVLPSLVTAKLAVYETMRTHGWSKVKLAEELGVAENSVRRLLNPRQTSHIGDRRRGIGENECRAFYRSAQGTAAR